MTVTEVQGTPTTAQEGKGCHSTFSPKLFLPYTAAPF
jgi:hypothetical protein